MMLRALLLLPATHARAADLAARLNPPASTGPCTVLEIERDSVPAATTWFRLRSASSGQPMPAQMMGTDAGGEGLWFARTAPKAGDAGPKDVQQFPFQSTGEFNAGNVAQIVPANLSAEATTQSFIVEAWSDRNDLGDGAAAKLLASSAALAFAFDDKLFSKALGFDRFAVASPAAVPGMLTVTAQPTNATAMKMAKLVTWYGFEPPAAGAAAAAGSLPTFTLDTALAGFQYTTREFPTPTANFSFSSPGVWFVGIYGAWNGEYGFSFPKPENGVRTYHSFPLDNASGTTFQPLALVIPWENGSTPALPEGFAGPTHVAKPIPGDWRLALRVDRITVFHGGTAEIRCVHGPAYPNGGAFAPDVVEVEVPKGLRIVPPPPCPAGPGECGGSGYENVTDVSGVVGGGAVPAGYQRLRLEKLKKNEWGYLNNAVSLKTAVTDKSIEGRSFPLSRIRAYSGAANQARADNWQPLAIAVKKLTPVPALPKRLHTAYCWSGADEFVNDDSLGLNSISTWKALGFNAVPGVGASYATPPAKPGSILSPANRTGPEWAGMKYGIMTSPFGTAGFSQPPFGLGSFTALKLTNISASQGVRGPQGFNFSAAGVSAAQEKVERDKWKAALEFWNETGVMDISYDGFFKQNDLDTVTKLVTYAQPDYFSMDIESFPELEAWAVVGYKSANFARQKKAGETDSAATRRIAQSWLGGAVDAARKAAPHSKAYLYDIWARFDAGYQITDWPMAKTIGLADMPSYYGLQNGLDVLARTIRQEREAVGTGSELIPWFTPGETGGTGGPQSADPGRAMFNILIQGFASGMTGFNVYTSDGMYDMALWLAMRDAIAAVTPHEDLLCDGAPAPNTTFSSVAPTAVVSAMNAKDGGALLIASSTIPHGLATSFTVQAAGADASWKLCDVVTQKSIDASASGSASWKSEAEDGSVLLFAKQTPCHQRPGRAAPAAPATPSVKNDDERASLPYAPKPAWATKWRRHLDFTINHACWCNNTHTHDHQFKCAATPHEPNIGDYSCFQNYSGPAAAKEFAEFMVSMNVDSVQLESHPDSGWVTYYPTSSGSRPYPSLVKNKLDWLGDTIKALRAVPTKNGKTLGVFLYMNVGSSNRYAGERPEYTYSQYNLTTAFEGGSTICQNAPGHLETLVNLTNEIVSRYRPDAFRFDGLADGLGHCYTEGDKAFYKELYNEEMPTPFAPGDRRRQYDFYRETTTRTMRTLRTAMLKIKPDIMTWANGYGPYRQAFTDGETLNDMNTCAETNDVAFSEFSSVFLWAIQQATTVATKGTVNGCMLGCDTSSMHSGAGQIEAAWEAVARGAIMYSYFEPPLMNLSTGFQTRGWTKEDPAGSGYNETLFRWFYGEQAKVDEYLDNATQVDLPVAIIFSENTRLRYANYFRKPYIQALESLYNMPLLAKRGGSLSMQFINALQLSGLSGPPQDFLSRFSTVVLLESSGLSAQQSQVLEDYAAAGGRVVLSGDALRFDENGTMAKNEGGLTMRPEVTGITMATDATECYHAGHHTWTVTSHGHSNTSGSLPRQLPASSTCANLVTPSEDAEVLASLDISNDPDGKTRGQYPLVTRHSHGQGAVYYSALKWDNSVGTGSGNCGDGASNASTHVVFSVLDDILTDERAYPYTVERVRSCHEINCTVCSACCHDWIQTQGECDACVAAECESGTGTDWAPLCTGGAMEKEPSLRTQLVLTTQKPPHVAEQRWMLWFLRKEKISVTLHAPHVNATQVVKASPASWSGYATTVQANGDFTITVTAGEDTPLRMLVLKSDDTARGNVVYRSTAFANGDQQPPGGIYRIPVVVTMPDNAVLAFAENRYGHGDGAALKISMRRSTTGGRSWGPIVDVVNDTDRRDAALGDGVTNGLGLVDSQTNRTFFFFSECSHECKYTKSFFISSDDFGLTWAPAVNLTDLLLPSSRFPGGIDFVQFGEGQGVQLPSGRLVVCGWYGYYKTDFDRGVACLISDAHGAEGSWRIGGTMAHPNAPHYLEPNEVGMALLENNSILLNARAEVGCTTSPCLPGQPPQGIGGHRILARSDDGGETIVDEHVATDLLDIDCNGGMISLTEGRLQVFSNPQPRPFEMFRRQNITLSTSRDGGNHWALAAVVDQSFAAYSTLTAMPSLGPRHVGVLYERGSGGGQANAPNGSIVFAVVEL